MRLIRHDEDVYSIREGEVAKWPLSKGMKMSQTHNIPLERSDNNILCWPDVHLYLNSIIKRLPPAEFITCPPGRGGLVPAAIVAYKLDIPFRAWESVTPLQQKGLCIDDIVDTGSTFKDCMKEKPWLAYCAMTSRWSDFGLIIGRVLYTPEYIIFPWDV